MNKVAFVYPGQGSQFVGMGADLYEKYSQVRDYYAVASDVLGFDLADLSFNGPEEKLRQTQYTQPALFVHSAVLTTLLGESGCRADMVAGHSLGEYSALFAAGALDFEQGLKLVKIRGKLMQNAGAYQKGTMAAIIGIVAERVAQMCQLASKKGLVGMANFNSPTQIVVSGSREGVTEVMRLARLDGAKRVIELNVSGAFHSPLMKPALEEFSDAVDSATIVKPSIPVYMNVTAEAVTDVTMIKDLLKKQLVNPVLWTKTVERMIEVGVSTFVEVGAGNVLSNLIRRIQRGVKTMQVNSADKLEQFELENVVGEAV